MEGTRYNQGKLKWSLVDFESLEPLVQVLMFGAKKYAPGNWKKGLKINEIMESSLRHTFAYLNGEDKDPESGLPHLGHIMCNIMFATWMQKHRPEMDDRNRELRKENTQLEIQFDESLTTSEQ